ncbi:hypothetical protein [Chachezhania sediminis]|uniref:hypothetical protein n=1 Tax=Chachezhania sediminis TaxID=2599291 RepID=UPI00131D47E0|nr:hypothetical protein [Chachezhania sediminis]
MKTVHIHLGPHGAGDRAIAQILDTNATDLRDRLGLSVLPAAMAQEAADLLNGNETAAGRAMLGRLATELRTSSAEGGILSCAGLAGPVPGLAPMRRPYRNLAGRIRQILMAFNGLTCRIYFLCPPEKDWIRSLHADLLAETDAFPAVEDLLRHLKMEEGWAGVLAKPREVAGDRLEILRPDSPENAARLFLDCLEPSGALSADLPEETAPPVEMPPVQQAIARAASSEEAKRAAREFLAAGPAPAQPLPDMIALPDWPPKAPVLPVPGALRALSDRAGQRVSHQARIDNVLPPRDVDLTALRTEIVEGSETFPGGKRQNMADQVAILSHRLRGLPAATLLNALAISYLRRDTDHTDHARTIFHRLWAEEHALLLATLPPRWLISTLQTFMDHGLTEDQRMIGSSGYFFANLLKAYEGERAIEGLAPDAIYDGTQPTTKSGFNGMDRFKLGGTDLMLNTLALLLEMAGRDPVAGRVLTEYLLRLKTADTLFSRMDRSRLYHGADLPGFRNCWSFFEPPSDN